jgi:hypothetical protein
MKTLTKILAALVISSSSTQAFADQSLCKTFGAAREADQLKEIRSVNPATARLSKIEKGIIQTTILAGNPGEPMELQQAIDQFTDKDSEGTNGGNLVYFSVAHNNKNRVIVQAVYYPGDNAYGAIYSVTGSGRFQSADLLGFIQDGDLVCLTYE